MRIIALDLGTKGIAVSEVRGGTVIRRWMVADLKALEEILGANTPPARVAFEACREAWHVHDWLLKRQHVPILVDTTRVKTLVGIGHHGRKNDRIDADKLALALDAGRLPEAHVLTPPRRELRAALGVRATLVATRSEYITTIRGLARSRGVKLPACQSASFAMKVQELQLEDSVQQMIKPLLSTLPGLDEQIQAQDVQLDRMTKNMPEVRLLATAPGVGMITACAFVAVIDYPDRFPNGHAVSSYLGLAPAEFSTGGGKQQRLGGITKHGNSYARTVLVEAAQSLLRAGAGDDPLARWGRQVEQRRGRSIAAVAIARRLAGILWAMWHTNTPYNCQVVKDTSVEGWEEQHRQRLDAALGRSSRKLKRRLAVGTASANGNRIPQQSSRRGSPRTRQPPAVAP